MFTIASVAAALDEIEAQRDDAEERAANASSMMDQAHRKMDEATRIAEEAVKGGYCASHVEEMEREEEWAIAACYEPEAAYFEALRHLYRLDQEYLRWTDVMNRLFALALAG